MARNLQNIQACLYRQEPAGSVGEKAIPGVPCEPPADCSGPVHGEAARCHEVGRVEDSGRPVLLEFPEL